MIIKSLGYLGFNSEKLDEWVDFGTRVVGLQLYERSDDVLTFRMDERQQRIIVRRAPPDTGWSGWEVEDAAALEVLRVRLTDNYVPWTELDTQALALRGVCAGISFSDPAGNRHEAFHGANIVPAPFVPGRPISGFRTGDHGLGHVVYQTPALVKLQAFFEGVLGFGLSDYFYEPVSVAFFHVNARHHSLALAQTPNSAIHHVMFELNQLDDVGQGYDVARAEPGRVAVTLGRHINDLMTSYYVRSPDGFLIECGWGGRSIDVDEWEPFELAYGPSLWGHDREWPSKEAEQEADAIRDKAREDGLRLPVQVAKGNYNAGYEPLAWWEQNRRKSLPEIRADAAEADAAE
ncbi:Glyoxalase/bleomycin resistance protein/dioxygenase [Novosphingobium sp. Rr 2-17]|uniref:VOC family protein n=1 Tax=Novosphingobium sp. Rr 2-17 TaxID=555793 RepID=UPI0002697E24|nr:VOC family protein [Novosphingobium sp. Rr 2-17]EIZ81194.1 Glyoxalase/bleomycin resistance protein/dioxygenase [Novosphingobium sp. Rr 2-17]